MQTTFVLRIQGFLVAIVVLTGALAMAQTTSPAAPIPTLQAPSQVFSEADRLRGTYCPYRANNDLLYYHLDVRMDPDQAVS